MNYLYAYEAVAGNKYSISSSESTVASIGSVLGFEILWLQV